MQAASIVPQSYLHLIENDRYHMCLAHLLDTEGMESYTQFYRRKAREAGNYVIMDNGLIETGEPLPIRALLDIGFRTGVQEIALPDVFRNSKDTIDEVDYAVDYILAEGYKDAFSYMAIPQGSTLKEWLDCADTIIQNFGVGVGGCISTLGIPKVLVDIAGRDGRLEAIYALAERHPDISLDYDIHLLGCWTTPIEIMMLAKASEEDFIPRIRGVDSCLPYVYARASKRFSDCDRPDAHSLDFKDGVLHTEDELYLKLNLAAWRDACDMSTDKTVWFI